VTAEGIVSSSEVASGFLVATLGSTVFILFIMHRSGTALLRYTLGGHLIALGVAPAITSLVSSGAGQCLVGDFSLLFEFESSLAVDLSMFFMAATDTEHPLAAGTALAGVTSGFTRELALFFVASVFGLVVVHRLLCSRMRDLY